MRQLPPLAAVRVFEAAARHLNFTRAAAELGMTQAAVSYQIRLIEERLGTPLFHRDKGRVSLTDAGRRAAPLVSNAFDALGEAFAAVRGEAGSVLTISAANTIAANWLVPRLGRFQLRHPDLAVRLESSNSLVDFARDAADVAIRLTVNPGPGLAADRLFPSAFAPMASPAFLAANPLRSPADLLTAARISPDDGWWRQWFETAGVAAAAAVERRGALLFDSQVIEGASAHRRQWRGAAQRALLGARPCRRTIGDAVSDRRRKRGALLAGLPAGAPQCPQDPAVPRLAARRGGGRSGPQQRAVALATAP